ncbi:MAG: sulfatase [Planctomycetaceae bacterium]|nr:sulfatase [Planctomycetales bacterium]MCB9923305.1 sulfatase [Planctomycetaceae bacterium]
MYRLKPILICGHLLTTAMLLCDTSRVTADISKPNIVFLFCDNLGYGDAGCFGSTKHRTPHIDRMAAEGMRLTSFYSASGVCTPSRAALMTGCYPRRVGLHKTDPDGVVLRPVSPNGLAPNEITIAEVLKAQGYATTCIGKWHLGDQPELLPTRQGFDSFFGIPYSDDMTPREGQNWPELPLMRDEVVIEAPVDRDLLTKRYTEAAVAFIEQNQQRPFFLYLPHAMPGSTRSPYSSEAFRGTSANGPYGDSVEEIDWSTGEILNAIKKLGLDENTLVIWTSDNGAPRRDPPQGSNAPLGGWGYTTMEGGMRVPAVIRWPGKVPAGTSCNELCSLMDMLPTFANLAGGNAPTDRKIDGHDIWPLLSGKANVISPYSAFYYYHMDQLQAVRDRRWKLHLSLANKSTNLRDETAASAARLYDLDADIGETTNVAAEHPEVVRRLEMLAELARQDIGDRDRRGANERPVGRVEDPKPQVLHP